MATTKELRKELQKLGIKTYRNKKTQASFVKRSDVVRILADGPRPGEPGYTDVDWHNMDERKLKLVPNISEDDLADLEFELSEIADLDGKGLDRFRDGTDDEYGEGAGDFLVKHYQPHLSDR